MTIEDAEKFIRAIKIDSPTLLLCDQDEVDLVALSERKFDRFAHPVLLLAVSSPLSIQSLTLQQLKDAITDLEVHSKEST